MKKGLEYYLNTYCCSAVVSAKHKPDNGYIRRLFAKGAIGMADKLGEITHEEGSRLIDLVYSTWTKTSAEEEAPVSVRTQGVPDAGVAVDKLRDALDWIKSEIAGKSVSVAMAKAWRRLALGQIAYVQTCGFCSEEEKDRLAREITDHALRCIKEKEARVAVNA